MRYNAALVMLALATAGCGFEAVPEVRALMTATRAAASGILELIDFIEGAGDDASEVRNTLQEKDYGKALAMCYVAVEGIRERGMHVPEHVDRALYLVQGAMAAEAFGDLARAMRSTIDE